jgi:histidinol-phosphate aminotransferase
MHSVLANCLRITVSTPEENSTFLDAFAASLAA